MIFGKVDAAVGMKQPGQAPRALAVGNLKRAASREEGSLLYAKHWDELIDPLYDFDHVGRSAIPTVWCECDGGG